MKALYKLLKTLMLSVVLINIVSCAEGNCRENMEKKKQSAPVSEQTKTQDLSSINKADRVRIYKYDGSLQCGMGETISVDKMKLELKDIQIFSASNKMDGLMHIQQCGTPTGKANVFEILKSDLPNAIKLGFKEWLWD